MSDKDLIYHEILEEIENLNKRKISIQKKRDKASSRGEIDELNDKLVSVNRKLRRANDAMTEYIVDDYREKRRQEYIDIKPD